MSFQHPLLDLMGGWENVRLMLGAKEYKDRVLQTYQDGTRLRVLNFEFESKSCYGSITSIKVILTPNNGETPISSQVRSVSYSLKRDIEILTGKTLSFW